MRSDPWILRVSSQPGMKWTWIIGVLLLAGCSSSSPVAVPSALPPPVVAPPPAPLPMLPPRDPVQFNQIFWDEFVHNAYDAPGASQPLRRLTQAPMIYLKTVDEAGLPIDAATLDTVENALRFIAPTWGGGQFGLAGMQRGTGSMEGRSGWYTVKWPNPSAGDICGRSDVAVDGGQIELNYLHGGTCSCNGSKIRPRTVYHELGHAFGFFHTDSDTDIMKAAGPGCDARPSAREVYHAQLHQSWPIGTTDAVHHVPMIID